MVFPAFLLGAALAGRESMAGSQRSSLADTFRAGLGSVAGAEYGGQGGLMEGDPAQTQPGSGMLGTTTDPQGRAFLEMLGKMAGERGVTPQQLMQGAERVMSEQGLGTRQGANLAAQAEQQQNEFGFREYITLGDRDFTDAQNKIKAAADEAKQRGADAQAWAMMRYRERAADARAQNKSDLPSGLMYYPIPGAQDNQGRILQVSGPRPGTPEFRESMGSTRFARDAVENVDFLMESYLMGGRGREFFGEAGGAQRAAYNRFIGDLAATRGEKGLGVLQEADREYLQRAFSDPGSFLDKLNSDPQMMAAMGRARQDLQGLHNRRMEENPWLAGAPVGRAVGPAPTAESVARKYSNSADAEIRARWQKINPRERVGKIRPAN